MNPQAHFATLLKILSHEQRLGCEDKATTSGLTRFLAVWQADGGRLAQLPPLQQALAPLSDYSTMPQALRTELLAQALALLQTIDPSKFEAESSTALPAPTPKPKPAKAKPTAPKPPANLTLQTPLEEIPALAYSKTVLAAFKKRLNLHTVADILYHFPHRYDDYSAQNCIAQLEVGKIQTITVTVSEVRTFPIRSGSKGIEVQVRDQSGDMSVTFFGNYWLAQQFKPGRKIVLSGKVTLYQGIRQMTSPKWEPFAEDELLHTGRLVPAYPLTKGLHEKNARRIIKNIVDQAAPLVADYLPKPVLERNQFLPLAEALAQIHFPASSEQLAKAHKRLAFDEFLLIQLGVLQRRMLWQAEMAFKLDFSESAHQNLLENLSFSLTKAQERVLGEIFTDLKKPVPMARLLQGDVGSGKTVVAAAALVQAIANGFQGALMAPTQILAEQHYQVLRRVLRKVAVPRSQNGSKQDPWKAGIDQSRLKRLEEMKLLLNLAPEDDLDGQGIKVALLTGNLRKRERQQILEALAKGDIDLVVGTHALFAESVQFQNLGLVCIDEQHRFGVQQRELLKQKGFNPHMLVMTATPIPRSLTLTIYGELDASVLDEMPPGRQTIKTRMIARQERPKAYRHIRKEIEKGYQAFVICPLVEESEKLDLPSAEETAELLQKQIFPDLRVGLIHGQLLPRDKDQAMNAFREREFDILVATAVVEVGIDIPNATTIMIEGAERFGLAQLHQFRGRVGRGEAQSYCILVSDIANEQSVNRLKAMETSQDGFELAQLDLEMRGPGEFFGTRQSGTPDLKVANLADLKFLTFARQEAEQILAADPELAQPENRLLAAKVKAFWEKAQGSS